MPKFEVKAEMCTYLKAYVEAENEDEAWQKAKEMDGAEFDEIENTGAWDIYNVEEVEENA